MFSKIAGLVTLALAVSATKTSTQFYGVQRLLNHRACLVMPTKQQFITVFGHLDADKSKRLENKELLGGYKIFMRKAKTKVWASKQVRKLLQEFLAEADVDFDGDYTKSETAKAYHDIIRIVNNATGYCKNKKAPKGNYFKFLIHLFNWSPIKPRTNHINKGDDKNKKPKKPATNANRNGPTNPTALHGCGSGKGDFDASLNSENAWHSFLGQAACRLKVSNSMKATRDAAVKAWFASVTAAGHSSKELAKAVRASKAQNRRLNTAKNAYHKSSKALRHQRALAKRAQKDAVAAKKLMVSTNAAAARRTAAAKLNQVKRKNTMNRAVTKANGVLRAANALHSKLDKQLKANKRAMDAQQRQMKGDKRKQARWHKVNRINQAAKKASKAASLRAHKAYATGARKDAQSGYYH